MSHPTADHSTIDHSTIDYLTVDEDQHALQRLPQPLRFCMTIGYSRGIQLYSDFDSANMLADEAFLDDLIALYAADEQAAYHVWRRDGQWVVTRCDYARAASAKVSTHERQQLLFGRGETLVVTDYIEYDADGQAFVAYSHPTRLNRKEE